MHLHLHEIVVFVTCLVSCLVVVRNSRTLSPHRDLRALRQAQAIHVDRIPRLGGIAIFSSVLVTTLLVSAQLTPAYAMFVLGLMPLVAMGLYEDMGRPTKPVWRLGAIVLSSAFIIAALGVWLPRSGIPAIEPLMGGVFGAILTVAVVAGVTNAFNMIDGLNGLCSGIALSAFIAINTISVDIRYENMIHLSMMYIVAIVAFMLFNFPVARLYLGDTGAYLLGFILSWFAISVLLNDASVSPWAFFLIFGYPATDMLFSIARRIARGRSPFSPDAEHFHHLVLRIIRSTPAFERLRKWHNPIATLVVLPLAVAPMMYATEFHSVPAALFAAAAVVVLSYLGLYALMLRRLCRVSDQHVTETVK
jgi:UDP-GlcNAc:undecaprenyl-phosphate/decaprenyl-phosphate GlcNAc-1-phosphate transferase